MTKYISKGTWFAAGTECELIDDYRIGDVPMDCGLFRGPDPNPEKEGRIDEEVCNFDEFDIMEHICEEGRTCTCDMIALEPSEECTVHGVGIYPPVCDECGRFMKREKRIS